MSKLCGWATVAGYTLYLGGFAFVYSLYIDPTTGKSMEVFLYVMPGLWVFSVALFFTVCLIGEIEMAREFGWKPEIKKTLGLAFGIWRRKS